MIRTYIVVDDFLDNAMQLRGVARKLDYPERPEQQNYPGRNAGRRILIDGLDQAVSQIVGEPLKPTPGTSHGKFRLTLGSDEGKAAVHIDSSHWSGILYLTPDEHCQGGTDFYRHLPSGMDHAPYTEEHLAKVGLTDFSEVGEKLLLADTNDEAKWEHIMTLPMRFNRLVLFRPWLYHNAGAGFGDSFDNGRLIYPLFFDRAG
ncbi:MAG: DUF6445 family protein [Xanthomonadales bacterium]|nr:DUF6445 family protein [Xanthomonadales bacterium]